MNPLYVAAFEVQSFCQARGWKQCIIGGVAAARWGRPRATQDVDFSLLTGFRDEESWIDPLFAAFQARDPDARQIALEGRVVLATASNGVPIDIALAGFDYEVRAIERGVAFECAPGCEIVTASADDMVVMKALADRSIDWFDVEGILVCQGKNLDWSLIFDELTKLCAIMERPEIIARLQDLRRKIESEI